MAVKVADYLHKEMQVITFTMEDSYQDLCKEIGVDNLSDEFRGNGRADLVLRSKTGLVRHVIEFKRSIKKTEIKKDAIRLAKLCQQASARRRIEKNFLVAITHATVDLVVGREEEIRAWLSKARLKNIEVKTFDVNLGKFKSTRIKRNGEKSDSALVGRVWQFKYNPNL